MEVMNSKESDLISIPKEDSDNADIEIHEEKFDFVEVGLHQDISCTDGPISIKKEVDVDNEPSIGEPSAKKRKQSHCSNDDGERLLFSKLGFLEKEVLFIKGKQTHLNDQLDKTNSLLEVVLKQVNRNQELLEHVLSIERANECINCSQDPTADCASPAEGRENKNSQRTESYDTPISKPGSSGTHISEIGSFGTARAFGGEFSGHRSNIPRCPEASTRFKAKDPLEIRLSQKSGSVETAEKSSEYGSAGQTSYQDKGSELSLDTSGIEEAKTSRKSDSAEDMATSRRITRPFQMASKVIEKVIFADHSDEEDNYGVYQENHDCLEGDAYFLGEKVYIKSSKVDKVGMEVNANDVGPISNSQAVGEPAFKWKRTCPPIPKLTSKQPLVTSFDQCESPPTALDVFKAVTGLDILINDILIPQSQLYMEQKGIPFSTSHEEISLFLGLSYRKAYYPLPQINNNWSKENDLHVACVANFMPERRYEEIKAALHFCDNSKAVDRNHPMYDKAYKVRPLFDHLNNHFQKALKPTQKQSISEHTIKSTKFDVMRQYVNCRPIIWAFKMWCRCDASSGYLFEADLYTGKKQQLGYSLGESVVLQLTQGLCNLGVEIFIDNFFNSPQLQRILKTRGINCCGTVRPNAKHMPPNLKDEKSMERGETDRVYANGVSCIKWKDDKSVIFLSNYLSPMPMSEATRGEKNNNLPQPEMVRIYNLNRTGVDIMGQKKVPYSIDKNSRDKFYFRIFFDLMDIAVNNAEFIYQTVMKTKFPNEERIKDSFDFRTAVVTALIGDCKSRQSKVPLNHPSRLQPFIPLTLKPHQMSKKNERR